MVRNESILLICFACFHYFVVTITWTLSLLYRNHQPLQSRGYVPIYAGIANVLGVTSLLFRFESIMTYCWINFGAAYPMLIGIWGLVLVMWIRNVLLHRLYRLRHRIASAIAAKKQIHPAHEDDVYDGDEVSMDFLSPRIKNEENKNENVENENQEEEIIHHNRSSSLELSSPDLLIEDNSENNYNSNNSNNSNNNSENKNEFEILSERKTSKPERDRNNRNSTTSITSISTKTQKINNKTSTSNIYLSNMKKDDRLFDQIRIFRRLTDPRIMFLSFVAFIILYLLIFGMIFGFASVETRDRWCRNEGPQLSPFSGFFGLMIILYTLIFISFTIWALVQYLARKLNNYKKKKKTFIQNQISENLNNYNNNLNNNNDNDNNNNANNNLNSITSITTTSSSSKNSKWFRVHDPLLLRPQAYMFALSLPLVIISSLILRSVSSDFYVNNSNNNNSNNNNNETNLRYFLIGNVVRFISVMLNYGALMVMPTVITLWWQWKKKKKKQNGQLNMIDGSDMSNPTSEQQLPISITQMKTRLRANPQIRSLFRRYCKQEFSIENLSFWERVQLFYGMKSTTLNDQRRRKEEAAAIIDLFIRTGSAMEINTTQKVRTNILNSFEMNSNDSSDDKKEEEEEKKHLDWSHLFDEAMEDALRNMMDTWTRFIETKSFRGYLKNSNVF